MVSLFFFFRALNSTDDLSGWLDSAYSYLAMVDYPYPADFMMPLPGHPIKEVYFLGSNTMIFLVTYSPNHVIVLAFATSSGLVSFLYALMVRLLHPAIVRVRPLKSRVQ